MSFLFAGFLVGEYLVSVGVSWFTIRGILQMICPDPSISAIFHFFFKDSFFMIWCTLFCVSTLRSNISLIIVGIAVAVCP